jgi:phosphatidate cytidylyltransferase
MSETGIRSLTGLLFAAIVLSSVVWSVWSNFFLWILVALVAIAEWRRPLVHSRLNLSLLFACLMLGLLCVHMRMVWSPVDGFNPAPLLTCIALIWTNDTGAYLVGKPWGKHKLLPRISPGKSWEGLLGGVVLASLVSGLLIGWSHAWIGGVLGLVATAGDLLESSWKRGHGIKDSGSILPGHGGVLDRFDGFVFAVPLFALLIRFLDVDLFLNSWFT